MWNGNVPLHEWSYKAIGLQSDEKGNTLPKEPVEDITTWVFEAGTFVPTAKIQESKQYSIVSDYLGTPIQMYDGQGNKTWDCTLDIYGKVLAVDKGTEFDCPFRFQGQYKDSETGLYYNRLRFYDSNIGNYLNQDPTGLIGGNPTLYGYVKNINAQIDLYGLCVYELVATSDGWYPVYEKGKLNPTSYVRLNQGDVYKIGESQNPQSRYSQVRLDEARINKSTATSVAIDTNGKPKLDINGNIMTAGLEMDIDQNTIGNTKQADRSIETQRIKTYEQNNHHLPAGNKTHH